MSSPTAAIDRTLSPNEISMILDAFDEYRKTASLNLAELSALAALVDKFMTWLQEARIGISISSGVKNNLGIGIGDYGTDATRSIKDSLGTT